MSNPTPTDLLSGPTLVAVVAELSGLQGKAVKLVLDALALVTRERLATDQTVRLPGLGDLKPKRVAAKAGVCAFGEYRTTAHRKATFTPAKVLREAIAPLSD